MTKNYMVAICEKKKPLLRGVTFFSGVGKHTKTGNYFRREIKQALKRWFIHEPDGVLTLDSPSLLIPWGFIFESYSLHLETKVSTILAETLRLEIHKAWNVPNAKNWISDNLDAKRIKWAPDWGHFS